LIDEKSSHKSGAPEDFKQALTKEIEYHYT